MLQSAIRSRPSTMPREHGKHSTHGKEVRGFVTAKYVARRCVVRL